VAKSKKDSRPKKTIVVAFGRFQPPTSGHQLLFNKVLEVAKRLGADHAIGMSYSKDPIKNPLSTTRKLFWMRKFAPGVKFIEIRSADNPAQFLYYLAEKGYTDIVMVGGSDRQESYSSFDRLKKSDPPLKVNSVRFVLAGKKRNASAGVAGISGSGMRDAIMKGNLKKFASGLPNTATKSDVAKLFSELKYAMKRTTREGWDFQTLHRETAAKLWESDKYKRRPKTPGQKDGFSKHNTRFRIPPCNIDEGARDWFHSRWGITKNTTSR